MDSPVKKCYKCHEYLSFGEPVCSGLHPFCFCSWFKIESLEDFQDVIARSSEVISNDWARITSSFFHGRFRKYSARLGQKSYLLKVQQPEVPELPAMEYLCNQIAKSVNLWVPNHFFIRFQDELDTFVSENFMQEFPGCDLVHIYRFLEKPDHFSCEGLLYVLEREVKSFDEIQRFIKLCLFDALIGNHDRHGRNLGLIQTGSKLLLAPFYDNPSYLALEDPLLLGAHHEPRGAIATLATKEPTMRDYVSEWYRLGFAETVNEFKNQIDLENIYGLIGASFISPKRQKAFINLINRRYKELCDASAR